jgi:hypothetical protein
MRNLIRECLIEEFRPDLIKECTIAAVRLDDGVVLAKNRDQRVQIKRRGCTRINR